jgi:type IV fimbrial biogenesis protein FimT
MKPERGFTLVEMMVAIAVVAVLLTLAAPSFYDFILVQRLKSTNAQLVTDMQFARSEASSRGVDVQVIFSATGPDGPLGCYSIYTDSSADPRFKCDCTQPPAARCAQASTREIRTVQIPVSLGVRLSLPEGQARDFAYQAITGGITPIGVTVASPEFMVQTSIDASRKLNTWIGRSGRPSVCSPGGAVGGFAPCIPE